MNNIFVWLKLFARKRLKKPKFMNYLMNMKKNFMVEIKKIWEKNIRIANSFDVTNNHNNFFIWQTWLKICSFYNTNCTEEKFGWCFSLLRRNKSSLFSTWRITKSSWSYTLKTDKNYKLIKISILYFFDCSHIVVRFINGFIFKPKMILRTYMVTTQWWFYNMLNIF